MNSTKIETFNKIKEELVELLNYREVDEELGYDPLLNIINAQYCDIMAFEEYNKIDDITKVWDDVLELIKWCNSIFDNIDYAVISTPKMVLDCIDGIKKDCEKIQAYYTNQIYPQDDQYKEFPYLDYLPIQDSPKDVTRTDVIFLIKFALAQVIKFKEQYSL